MDWKLFKKLLVYFRPYRFLLVLSILCLVAAKMVEASVPVLLGRMTNDILDHVISWDFLYSNYWFILGLLFASYILDSISVSLKVWIGQKAIYTLREEIYHHLIRMPLRYYDQNAIGRLMTRTIHDVDQINQMFAESIVPMIGNFLLFISITIGVIVLDSRLFYVMIIIVPAIYWLTNHFRHYQSLCYHKIRTIIASMNGFVQEHLMGASVIRSFGLQAKEKEVFDQLNIDHCEAHKDTIRNFAFFSSGIEFLQSFSLISVFVLLTTTTMGFEMQAGTFFGFSLYILMIFRPLMDVAERYNVLQASFAAGARVFELLDQKEEDDQGTRVLNTIDEIEFQDVWFSYDEKQWVYQGLNFSLKRGEKVALVGQTGAGKTTIMSLLLRLYRIQKGAIKINGIDIQNYTLGSLRSQFALVLQDPVLFSGTVEENISLFSSKVQLKEIGVPLPLQKKLSERGKSLSVGERQLISMARALAFDRPMLLLDEATANIDTATEQLIQKALKRLLTNSTALIIAHRLSTIKDVDRILLISGGKVAEEGTHESLLEQQGFYEKLHRLQF